MCNKIKTFQRNFQNNPSKNNKIDIKIPIENHKNFIINNILILKSQQRFKSERYNVFAEEIGKISVKFE